MPLCANIDNYFTIHVCHDGRVENDQHQKMITIENFLYSRFILNFKGIIWQNTSFLPKSADNASCFANQIHRFVVCRSPLPSSSYSVVNCVYKRAATSSGKSMVQKIVHQVLPGRPPSSSFVSAATADRKRIAQQWFPARTRLNSTFLSTYLGLAAVKRRDCCYKSGKRVMKSYYLFRK